MDIIDGGNLDSVKYWKDVAAQYKQKSSDLAQELDEFTTNSAQLEKELEVSLVQQEKINRDLVNCNKKLKSEVEQYKVKLERSQKEVLDLEAQIHNYKDDLSKQLTLIRELEQKNDDLERGQRVVSETVTYIETMLNQAYERNAVLESEVDEVEALRVELQRATDEARDLKQELKVKDKIKINGEGENENEATDPLKNIRQVVEANTQTLNISEVNGNGGSETSLSPASRITSLNIIGDILKRVGLEKMICSSCNKIKCSCSTLSPVSLDQSPCFSNSNLHYKKAHLDSDADRIEFRVKGSAARLRQSDHSFNACSTNGTHPLSEDNFLKDRNGQTRKSILSKPRAGLSNWFRSSIRRPSSQHQKNGD